MEQEPLDSHQQSKAEAHLAKDDLVDFFLKNLKVGSPYSSVIDFENRWLKKRNDQSRTAYLKGLKELVDRKKIS